MEADAQAASAGTAGGLERPNRILMHCPEITLKGRNTQPLQHRLRDNVARRLGAEGLEWTVQAAYGRLYVDVPAGAEDDVSRAVAALKQVPGLSSVLAAVWLKPSQSGQHRAQPDWPLVEAHVAALAEKTYAPHQAFAVRVNRNDDRVAEKAPEIERRLGDVIRRQTAWERVSLGNPDRTFFVDIYGDGMFFYTEKPRGVGGLPVGASGKVLTLLSGGIDSPVAAFMLAKRGCEVDLFHMSASYLDAERADASVPGQLARHISRYALNTRLWVAPYVHFDMALPDRDASYALVLFRRFLLRTAERIAERAGARAIVTGDSLGQVASQTLDNIVSTSHGAEMPLMRPLIGLNKEEIIEIARRIDTFETSIQPYKDCCALLSRNPRSRTTPHRSAALERRLIDDYEELIAQTLRDTVCVHYDCGHRIEARDDERRAS